MSGTPSLLSAVSNLRTAIGAGDAPSIAVETAKIVGSTAGGFAAGNAFSAKGGGLSYLGFNKVIHSDPFGDDFKCADPLI